MWTSGILLGLAIAFAALGLYFAMSGNGEKWSFSLFVCGMAAALILLIAATFVMPPRP